MTTNPLVYRSLGHIPHSETDPYLSGEHSHEDLRKMMNSRELKFSSNGLKFYVENQRNKNGQGR